MNWYSKVSKDIAYLPDCIDHYYLELEAAKTEVKVYGNVEKASAALPGIVAHRFNQLQEIEGILEYLNIELRRLRSKTFKKYLENYQRALSSRDVEKYVDGEADVVDMEKIIFKSIRILKDKIMNRAKKKFLRNRNHDLRTHLTY